MGNKRLVFKIFLVLLGVLILSMCVPPGPSAEDIAERARQDSLRNVRCPRLMSSAAEYYHARDWESTVRVYSDVVELGCDEWDPTYAPPEEIYQYYAIAFEQMDKFDSSEYVLLLGVDKIPNNLDLRERLAYAYERQGKSEQEIVEYERILDELDSTNIRVMEKLANLYRKSGRYEEEVRVLQNLIGVDPTNEAANADLASALERTGKDPLEVYQNKFDNNPNGTNAIQLADAYIDNDRIDEAIDVLKSVYRREPDNKLIFNKLGAAYISNSDFKNASWAYEQVYAIDSRDNEAAIKVADVNSELGEFGKALTWANKAIRGTNSSAEALASKGNVYYSAFQACRTPEVSRDDRIVARLAYKYFAQAQAKGNRDVVGSMNWLSDNEVLFSKSDWFMLDGSQKATGYAVVKTECYNWVTEKLYKESSW